MDIVQTKLKNVHNSHEQVFVPLTNEFGTCAVSHAWIR